MSQPVQRLILSTILYISSTTGTIGPIEQKILFVIGQPIIIEQPCKMVSYLRPCALFKQPDTNSIWCGLYEH